MALSIWGWGPDLSRASQNIPNRVDAPRPEFYSPPVIVNNGVDIGHLYFFFTYTTRDNGRWHLAATLWNCACASLII